MRCKDDNIYRSKRSEKKQRDVINHRSQNQPTVRRKVLIRNASGIGSYLHLDQGVLDFMEIGCELLMDLAEMIEL